jgi:hypothetical protein
MTLRQCSWPGHFFTAATRVVDNNSGRHGSRAIVGVQAPQRLTTDSCHRQGRNCCPFSCDTGGWIKIQTPSSRGGFGWHGGRPRRAGERRPTNAIAIGAKNRAGNLLEFVRISEISWGRPSVGGRLARSSSEGASVGRYLALARQAASSGRREAASSFRPEFRRGGRQAAL